MTKPYHLMTNAEKIDFVESDIRKAQNELDEMKSELDELKSCSGCPCHIHTQHPKAIKHRTPCREKKA